MKQFVACDCDGVLTNGFIDKLVELYNDNTAGAKLNAETIFDDIRDYYSRGPERSEKSKGDVPWKLASSYLKAPGFVKSFAPYPHVQEVISGWRRKGIEVIFVTAPYVGAPWWYSERAEWLIEHFGANHDNIIFARDKSVVAAECLIDDKISNCVEWTRENEKDSILIATPQNQKVGLRYTQPFSDGVKHSDNYLKADVVRTKNWDYINDYILGTFGK